MHTSAIEGKIDFRETIERDRQRVYFSIRTYFSESHKVRNEYPIGYHCKFSPFGGECHALRGLSPILLCHPEHLHYLECRKLLSK